MKLGKTNSSLAFIVGISENGKPNHDVHSTSLKSNGLNACYYLVLQVCPTNASLLLCNNIIIL